jgi:hypothetical protein
MFKNWKTICGITDKHFMWAIALLDRTSDFGKMVAERFTEYFTDEQQIGPYPPSLMRKTAQEKGYPGGSDHGEDLIVSNDAVPDGVPIQTFDKYGKNVAGLDGPLLPTEISPDAKQGDIVTWEGKRFVVLENHIDCQELSIAPAELIAVDR